MYFKNKIGSVYVSGNKIVSENQHVIMTLEIKDEVNIEKYFFMEVESLKSVSLQIFGHY